MMQTLLKFILISTHCFYSLLSSIYLKFNAVFMNFRTLSKAVKVFYQPKISRNDNEKLREYSKNASKIPDHLVFIMGNELVSYCDLVKLISWSLSCGISYISFYDHKSVISSESLFMSVVNYNKDILPFIKWGKLFDEDVKIHSKQLINGFKWAPRIEINVLRKEDGKQIFISTTASLCSTIDDVRLINESVIDASLKNHFSTPEPDLAIICGDTCCMFGLQPWILRVTEFLMLPSHHKICIQDFIRILRKYGRCEQRCGK